MGICKKITGVLFAAFLLLIGGSFAQGGDFVKSPGALIKEADRLFDRGRNLQSAIDKYEKAFEEAESETIKYKAVFRLCQGLLSLNRYEEAAERALNIPLPKGPRLKAVILLLRKEVLDGLYEYYQRNYYWKRDGGNTDYTKKDILEKIKEVESKLWDMRDILAGMRLEDFSYFFSTNGIEKERFPTLFDYFVNILFPSKAGQSFDFSKKLDVPEIFLSPINGKINWVKNRDIYILNNAAATFKKGRELACERWQVILAGCLISQNESVNEIEAFLKKQAFKYKSKNAKAEAMLLLGGIAQDREDFVSAVEWYEKAKSIAKEKYIEYEAKKRLAKIKAPVLQVEIRKNRRSYKNARIAITSRNVKRVYFRAYNIGPYEAKKIYVSAGKQSEREVNWSYILGPDEELAREYVKGKSPVEEWRVDTGDKGDHKYIDIESDLPDLKNGIYIILASDNKSFAFGKTNLFYSLVNISDIMVFVSSGPTRRVLDKFRRYIYANDSMDVRDDLYRIYVLDAKTGEIKDARLEGQYKLKGGIFPLKYKKSPLGSFVVSDFINPESRYYGHLSLLAKSKNNFAWPINEPYYSYDRPNPINIFAQIDSPIYKPGDTVHIKIVGVLDTFLGDVSLVPKGAKADIYLFDYNNRRLGKKEVALNEFGSASAEFILPKDALLGSCHFEISLRYKGFVGQANVSFNVEEYRQPEYKVEINGIKNAAYGKKARISGRVGYYFGGRVPGAKLHYTIKYRKLIFPCWGKCFYPSSDFEIFSSGDLVSNEKGVFEFDTAPLYFSSNSNTVEFLIEISARGPGGRVVTQSKSFNVSRYGADITVKVDKPFYEQGDIVNISINRVDANGNPLAGQVQYELFKDNEKLKEAMNSEAESSDSIKYLLDAYVKGKSAPVRRGAVMCDDKGKAEIVLKGLDPGAYLSLFKTKDSKGNLVKREKVVLISGKKGVLPVAKVCLADKTSYKPGDVAKVLIGSYWGSGNYFVELWKDNVLIDNFAVSGKGKTPLIEIPVNKDMQGGVRLNWFGASHGEIYQDSAVIAVEFDNKGLEIGLDPINNVIVPGKEQEWGVAIRDKQSRPVRAEVLAFMYDKALEYYSVPDNHWLDILYNRAKENGVCYSCASAMLMDFCQIEMRISPIEFLMKAWERLFSSMPPPRLRFPKKRLPYFLTFGDNYLLSFLYPRRFYNKNCWNREPGVVSCSSAGNRDSDKWGRRERIAENKSETNENSIASFEGVEIRKDFASTAFFMPHLVTDAKSGRALFSFKAPDQATSWQYKVLAFTKDLKVGRADAVVEAKKPLLVRIDMPRFFREKDRSQISVMVHNQTQRDLVGRVRLDITKDGKKVNSAFGLETLERDFAVPAGDMQAFSWHIDAPSEIGDYSVRAVAVGADETDGEERAFEVLPSRQRLIDSIVEILSGAQEKALDLNLGDDPTRINEFISLRIEPQVFLTVLNSVPFLLNYPYACIDQTADKYISLAIINSIYNRYPAVRKAVSKLPFRNSVLPSWEKNDERRMIKLIETPWLVTAEQKGPDCVINLFNPALVGKIMSEKLKYVQKAQLRNGAFPWLPGGGPDLYMTMYVLNAFAVAEKYGADISKQMPMLNKALAYVEKNTAALIKKGDENLNYAAFALYTLTSYDRELAKKKALLNKWAGIVYEQLNKLSSMCKAYLAYSYFRLGNKDRADEVLDIALDGAREDNIVGVYWTPESHSWMWYSDTIERHALFLRAIMDMRPGSKLIPGMIKWLLFNRKGNSWRSTRASMSAIFAILDYMEREGALSEANEYDVKWGEEKHKVKVLADDWIERPMEWKKRGKEITEDMYKAVISKKGPGVAYASLTCIYSTDKLPKAAKGGLISVERRYFVKKMEGGKRELAPINPGDAVNVGDIICVRLKIKSRAQFEYMHLKDPKPAGFESEDLLSGWKYNGLSYYQEQRASVTNFFINRIPHGEFVLTYEMRPTKPGMYKTGAAVLQSLYSPDITAHSDGFVFEVK